MSSRVKLTVLCLAALCACACAAAMAADRVEKFDESPNGGQLIEKQHQNQENEVNQRTKTKSDSNKNKPVNQQFPHAVLFGGTCGGTIISPNWVITAAHCTLFTGGRYVLAGTNNSDDGSGVSRRVKRLIIHPKFTVGPYWLDASRFDIKQVAARFDFMLAELEEALPVNNDTIVPAKLNDVERISPKTRVGYAGYGAENHGETMRHNMHAMELEILPEEECTKLIEYEPQDMLCARGVPPRFDSACNGDSGSGLVDENGVLMGIASWVENDAFECRNGSTVYFSRVSVARKWIRQVTKI